MALLSLGQGLGCGAASGVHERTTLRPLRPVRGRWVRLEQRQTVTELARIYGVPLDDLEELNGVDRRETLPSGEEVFIPERIPGASLASEPSWQSRAQGASRPPRGERRNLSELGLIWPVAGGGTVSSRFGRRAGRIHEGIDIVAAEGTPVLAAAAGEVIYAGSGVRGYGNLVILRHAGKVVTVYAHNRRNLVNEGQRVGKADVIAEIGRTGRASAEHLHFELRIGEDPVDPLRYLPLTGVRGVE